MARLLSLLALLVLLTAGTPAHAQTPPVPEVPTIHHGDIVDFAMDYTWMAMLGTVVGGLLGHELLGGASLTLAGALAGTLTASWLFITFEAQNYVIQRAAPGRLR